MKKISKVILTSAFVSLLMAPSTFAGDGKSLYKAKVCHTCHGVEGKKPIMPIYPKLAGQSEEYLFNQLKDIKSGKRSNGMAEFMKVMLANVSYSDFKSISKYLYGIN